MVPNFFRWSGNLHRSRNINKNLAECICPREFQSAEIKEVYGAEIREFRKTQTITKRFTEIDWCALNLDLIGQSLRADQGKWLIVIEKILFLRINVRLTYNDYPLNHYSESKNTGRKFSENSFGHYILIM